MPYTHTSALQALLEPHQHPALMAEVTGVIRYGNAIATDLLETASTTSLVGSHLELWLRLDSHQNYFQAFRDALQQDHGTANCQLQVGKAPAQPIQINLKKINLGSEQLVLITMILPEPVVLTHDSDQTGYDLLKSFAHNHQEALLVLAPDGSLFDHNDLANPLLDQHSLPVFGVTISQQKWEAYSSEEVRLVIEKQTSLYDLFCNREQKICKLTLKTNDELSAVWRVIHFDSPVSGRFRDYQYYLLKNATHEILLESLYQEVVHSMHDDDQNDLLRAIAKRLMLQFQGQLVTISEYIPARNQWQDLAIWSESLHALSTTPYSASFAQEQAIRLQFVHIAGTPESGLREHDTTLHRKYSYSCYGTIRNLQGELLGMVALSSKHTIENLDLIRALLPKLSPLLAVELEKRRYRKAMVLLDRRYRLLYNEMAEGVAFHELVYDDSGKPINYRILDVNSAYEKIMGLSRSTVIGKLATDAYGTKEAPFLSVYAAVAMSTIPYRFENHVEELDRDFDISVGSFEKGFFSTIFSDITIRRDSETALHLSESRLRLITDNMIDIVLQLDTARKFVYVSPSIRKTLGYQYSDLIGKDAYLFVHPIDRKKMILLLSRAIQNKEYSVTAESRLRNKQREYVWMESAVKILYDNKQEPSGYVVSIREITDRKKAQQALQLSESQFRALADGAKDAIFIKDLTMKYLFVNPSMAGLMGQTVENMVGHTDRELIGDLASSYEIADREVISGKTVETEPTERIGGSWKTLHTIKVPLKTKQGEIIGICGIARDVTERNQSELALRESEERFRLLVESLPVGIVAHCDGKIVFANDTIVKMMGYESVFDVLGLGALDFVYPADRQLVADRMRGLIDRRQPQPATEERFIKSDGTIFDVEVAAVPFMFQNRPAAQIVVTDISERKRAESEKKKLEAQIQHTQKLESLGVLAGGIAHDFNNLLVGILGNAGLAMLELPSDSPARRSVEAIEMAAVRASELTKQMLAYSGKGKFLIQSLSLSKVVEEIYHLLEVSISKRVVLSYNFGKMVPNIDADATQIRQVVMNLITNASEAIGDRNGVVTISTGSIYVDRAYLDSTFINENLPEGNYVFLEVTDNGSGMDRETLKKIFDPFFTTKFTGRGLGLAAVIGIVRGHNGTIHVKSELGKGTTFTVIFPASENQTVIEEATMSHDQTDWMGSGKVLVVDDEPAVIMLATQLLEMKGFTVVTAEDGVAAVEMYKALADEIQFVLLDLTLPKLNGEEVFHELRAIRPNVRVLLSSGYNEQEVTSRFDAEALAGFIQKPYRIQELLEKIRTMLSL